MGSLVMLQGQCKRDPDAYREEFELQLAHYRSRAAVLALQPSAPHPELAELATFMAHCSGAYPAELSALPEELMGMLDKHAGAMESELRRTLAKAVILLRNKGRLEAAEALPLFFRMFRLGDKHLRTLLFRHIIADIRGINAKQRQDAVNRQLQAFLFSTMQQPDEGAVKRSLAVLIELYRRNVWTDERSVNVIASAVQHKSTRVCVAALNFFMGVGMTDDGEDSDDEDEDDEDAQPGAKRKKGNRLSKSELYKAFHTGTQASRRKKQKKLERAVKSAARSERIESGEALSSMGVSALELLRDPHTFAEKLFRRLQGSRDKFETKMLMVQVVSRTIAVHRLVLEPFYTFIARYLQPQQREVTLLLTAAAEACHDNVPPDAIEPVLRQVVNAFVHDRSRPEAMGVGLKTVHALCTRCPLVMTEDLLRDLTAYKKDKDKGVRMASRSLIGLFRELAPGLLEKRDRGRGHDKTRTLSAFGEAKFAEGVAGAELLAEDERRRALGLPGLDESSDDEDLGESSDEEGDAASGGGDSDADGWESASDEEGVEGAEDDGGDWHDVDEDSSDESGDSDTDGEDEDDEDQEPEATPAAAKSRPSADPQSLRSLKKAAAAKAKAKAAAKAQAAAAAGGSGGDMDAGAQDGEGDMAVRPDMDRILTQEDFARIKALRERVRMNSALDKVGLRAADPDAGMQTVPKRVREEALLADTRRAHDKAARLATVLAGREGREFQSKAAIANKKTGGLTNAQQRKRKQSAMPAAAVRQAAKRGRKRRQIAASARERGFGGKKAYK